MALTRGRPRGSRCHDTPRKDVAYKNAAKEAKTNSFATLRS